jgi:Carboxypeptidase regulatory-like domain/Domain of unknown function (DUF4382)
MKRSLSLAIVTTIALSACTANGGSQTVPASSIKTQTHVRHLKSTTAKGARRPTDVLGGAPRFSVDLAMYDAPLVGASAANAQFNAGILGVDAIDQNGDSWQLVGSSTPQVTNLLALQNTSLDLGAGDLPPGTYPAIQLLLDPATTNVIYGGQAYPVHFVDPNHPWWDPTQTVEAVSIPLKITGNDGDALTATLDFNVFQSANLADGVVYLTPTVAAGMGQPTIAGLVVNAAGAAVSNATIVATDASGNVANTSVTAADGSFHLRGINPGGYTISVANTSTTNAGVTVSAAGADAGAAPSRYVVVGPSGEVNLGTLID